MPRIRKQIREIMNEMDARSARVRPGSVLILVVVLLVLMALLGTAYLVTARNERVATRLFSHNVQIDMLVQGVENMAIAAMTSTSYQASDVQHYDDWYTSSSTPLYTSVYATSPTNNVAIDHTWLASRYPETLTNTWGTLTGPPLYPIPKGVLVVYNNNAWVSLADNNTTDPPASASAPPVPNWAGPVKPLAPNLPTWTAVTSSLAARSFFEDPRYPIGNNRPDYVRTNVSPTYVTINGKNYPALQYWSTINNRPETALAASAAGNGIADSFLWRLPIGTVDGITYYAAVRIIDNNSAINVNTALSSSADYDGNGLTIANIGFGMFPASVGLAELTASFNPGGVGSVNTISPEIASLDTYRFNAPTASPTQLPSGISPAASAPLTDDMIPVNRLDFKFSSIGDALWMQLGRRINNPGVSYFSNTSQFFQPFTWGDAATLAHLGDLPNANASPSMLEQSLVDSVFRHGATPGSASASATSNFQCTPWDPSLTVGNPITAPNYWFAQYNDPPAAGNPSLNRRLYFTAHNPLSNAMPNRGLTTANTYLTSAQLGNLTPYMLANDPTLPGSPPPYLTGAAPRVSVNTAWVTTMDVNGAIQALPLVKGPTLWFGFYNAMLDAWPVPPLTANITTNLRGAGSFRSPIRDPAGFQSTYTSANTYLTGPETVVLRSLLAAVNAKDLRDSGDNVEPAHVAVFPAANVAGGKGVNMYAYGTERQVFITEVYANTEVTAPPKIGAPGPGGTERNNPHAGKKNPKGYVAVEIYNPYDFPVDMSWWTLMVATRTAAGGPGALNVSVKPITNFNGFGNTDGQNAVIPAKGYMLLENLPQQGVTSQSGLDATYRPFDAYTGVASPPVSPAAPAPATVFYYVPNLHEVFKDPSDSSKPGGELVLFRQIFAQGRGPGLQVNPADLTSGTGTIGAIGSTKWNSSLANSFSPVDSFDFTGVTATVDAPEQIAMAIHYVRANPGSAAPPASTGATGTSWRFVYPGRWDPTAYTFQDVAGNKLPYRQEGMNNINGTSTWKVPDPNSPPTDAIHYDKWADTPPTPAINFCNPGGDPTPSYVNSFPSIQLNNTDMGGPNKLYLTSPQLTYRFPFGQFARIGDVLQTPFIGAYMILDPTASYFIEINPVMRDCAAADDWDTTDPITLNDDSIEQVGRFCPLLTAQYTSTTPPAEVIVPTGANALNAVGGKSPYNPYDPYGWSTHVLDYFTTLQNPNDDYFPDLDPGEYLVGGAWDMGNLTYHNNPGAVAPVSVANTQTSNSKGPNNTTEDAVPVEGLININTANWRALAAIPWIPTTSGIPSAVGTPAGTNALIAQNIVKFRNTYGPFKTLLDLNKVPGLQDYGGSVIPTNADLSAAQGNISPSWGTSLIPKPATAFNTDNVYGDFETRFGMITRVSNLVTTRSDSFTVYVLVQGWSGVGTATPSLIVQRRAAFLADRSQITGLNTTLGIYPVPAN